MSGRSRPIVKFCGVAYEMDTQAARRALVRRQVEGEFYTMEGLARAAGYSRTTVSCWFWGRHASMRATLAILDRLHLTFDDVYRRVNDA
jgi:hypothetical protein